MKKIIQYKDNDGNLLYPKSITKAITHNGQGLDEYLSSLNVNSDGEINEDVTSICGILKRTLDGGFFTNNIKRTFIYKRNVVSGSVTITLNVYGLLMKDYIRVDANIPYTITSFTWGLHSVDIILSIASDFTNVRFQIDYVEADESNYSKVEITIPSTKTNITASIPNVKYNLTTPVMWTLDDGGASDFLTQWMRFNGYPQQTQNYGMHGVIALTSGDNSNGDADKGWHIPYTYPDGCGGIRRAAFTCALMYPLDILSRTDDQTKMILSDIKIMQKLGCSMSLHDALTTGDTIDDKAASFDSYLKENDNYLKENDAIGLKVCTEPSGSKEYTYNAWKSKNCCLVCAQANGSYNNIYFYGEESRKLSRWENEDVSSFLKSEYGHDILVRFFQPNIDTMTGNSWGGLTYMQANNYVLFYGGHGMTPDEMNQMRDWCANRTDLWVCSVDEFWEYYHIKNNTIIESCTGDGANVNVVIWIPNYHCHQFRELTLNLDITDGGVPTTSDNVIGLSYNQGESQYTMNICLEERWIDNAKYFMTLAEQYPTNIGIKRDALYLIDLLKDGTEKTALQARYDALN